MNSRCDFVRAAHAGSECKLVFVRMSSARYIIVVAGGRGFRAISAKFCAIAMTIRDCVQSFRDANRDVCVSGRKAFSTVQMFRADASKRHEGAKKKGVSPFSCCASNAKFCAITMTISDWVLSFRDENRDVCVGGRKSFSTVHIFRADASKRHEGAKRKRVFARF